MKNLLVMYYASGKIKVELMSAAEAIFLRAYDVENVTILNVTDTISNNKGR
jgi:hypothetical protein